MRESDEEADLDLLEDDDHRHRVDVSYQRGEQEQVEERCLNGEDPGRADGIEGQT